jgi:Zn-dependent peptidase ImmA (M78 family)/transcriptional regulator with XRE-family HTH domain
MINGLRVKQAREIRKLTQSELAKRIKQHQSVIGKMETDVRDWPESLIVSLALVLGFPVSFFHQGIGPEFPLGSLLFRCRADLPANEKTRIRQLSLLEYELCERLAIGTKPLQLHFPSFSGTDPKEAAKVTRTTLGLPPDTPIAHLINKLERNGIFVFAIPDAHEKFDAFSLWSDNDPRRPVVIVNTDKPTDRMRFNCAHELGHLVLHRSPRGNLPEMEKEAHIFASEFLMPEEAMLREIKRPVSLIELARLKPRWGVSIQALVVRAFELKMLNDRQYRYFFEQISKFGWRKREPSELDIKPERPRLFKKLAEMVYGIPPSAEKIAALVSMPVAMAEQMLAIHAGKSDLPSIAKGELSKAIEESHNNSDNVLNFKNARF